MTLILTVVFLALAFEFINGFHDTANSIATVVSTKVLTPRAAILMAASTNLLGALWGTAVAKTIASGLVDASVVNSYTLISALFGAIVWNLITWWFGMPSSSSHALIGGLCGAAVATAHNDFGVVIWSLPSPNHWWEGKGLLWKVVVPMFTSPILGLLLGYFIMSCLYIFLRNFKPAPINAVFGKAQIISAATMGFMHGTNDAQKTMGLIALALLSATQDGIFANVPAALSFLRVEPPAPGTSMEIASWIKISCSIVMAAGTAAGGWKIIKTLGHKVVKLQPIHGFAAETTSSLVLAAASSLGIPVSTTHNISASILGVGAAKRLSAVRWSVVEQMVWAWVLTLPFSGIAAYLCAQLLHSL